MKGVFIILDGLGDLPHKQLRNKTPLEVAKKPNIDFFSKNGQLGYMYPIKERFVPGTNEGVISILGQDWRQYPRGWLEALGAGIELIKGDLALRANFATIDNMKERNILDRRAGRTLTIKEARNLTKAINNNVVLPCKFIFKNTLQHRGVLVLKGGFSDNISNVDPAHYLTSKLEKAKLKFSVAEDEDENSKYSANIVNNFVEQSFKILDQHPINLFRRKKGIFPANIILLRAPGTGVKKINKFKKWACTTSVPVMKGICKSLGFNLFGFEPVEFKGYDAYQNFKKNLILEIKKSIRLIKKRKKDFDYFFIYLKETDAAGHDNKPIEKKGMIELIDKRLFSFLRKLAFREKIKLVVTADHSTPCKLKSHSADPVPVLFFGGKEKDDMTFFETNARKGTLGKVYGKDLLTKLGFFK